MTMRLPPNYAFTTLRDMGSGGGTVIRTYKEYLDARTWRAEKIKDGRVTLDDNKLYVVKWVDTRGYFGMHPGDYVWG